MDTGTKEVLASYAKALGLATVAILVGVLFGWGLTKWFAWTGNGILIYRCISVGILATSALGRLGWDIVTWSGGTPAERLNTALFRVIYLTGLVLTSSSFALQVTPGLSH
jgi:hypothetical protein